MYLRAMYNIPVTDHTPPPFHKLDAMTLVNNLSPVLHVPKRIILTFMIMQLVMLP